MDNKRKVVFTEQRKRELKHMNENKPAMTETTRLIIQYVADGLPEAYIKAKPVEGSEIHAEVKADWRKLLTAFYNAIASTHEEKMRKLVGYVGVIKDAHRKKLPEVGMFKLTFESEEKKLTEKKQLKSEVLLKDPGIDKTVL